EAAAVGFVEPGFEVDRRQIRELEDAGAGPGAIAFTELDAVAELAARSRVLENVHGAVGGRAQPQLLDRRLRALDVELRLVALPPLGHEIGLRPSLRRPHLRLRFLLLLLGVRERQL